MTDSQGNISAQFYKLIVPSVLHQNKLMIPNKFVKKFGQELAGFATLTVPDDRMWLVTVREIDCKLWFCEGWHEFVEHYSIGTGHFLGFKYEGKSNFNVYMYVLMPYKIKDGRTVTKSIQDDKQYHVLDEMEDGDDSVEILDAPPCFSPDTSKRKNFDECFEQVKAGKSCNAPLPHNEPKRKDCWNGDDEVSQPPSGGSVKSHSSGQASEDDGKMKFLDKIIQKHEKTVEKKQNIDEENFYPPNDADLALRSTNLTQDAKVESNSMKCQLSANDFQLKISDISAKKLRKLRRTKQEIASRNKTASERRAATPGRNYYKRASLRKRSESKEERERAVHAAKAFEPTNPFCRVVLRPSYLYKGCIMYLPSQFAEKHLNGVAGFIKLESSEGKEWPVFCCYREGKAKLSQGWYEFTLENKLGEGDVCVFELLRTGDILLKVTVFRVLESAGCMTAMNQS